MASGKAILAANAGQISEVLVDGQTALLFPPGDVEAMTTGLARLIDSPGTRAELGENARRQAVQTHSWEKYTHNLEQIYFQVLSREKKFH
jgi:glycosyltransferase involved in cell wall biosynthesis